MAKIKLAEACLKIGSGATPCGGKNIYCEDGISLIRSQNILDFDFSENGLAYINDDQAAKLKNVEVMEEDVLLNITGDSVARVAMMDRKFLPARVNQHVAIIRAKKEIIEPSYILYYLQYQKRYLLQLASAGATRKALTKSMIENLELELPAMEIQGRIVSILDNIQEKIATNRRINNNLLEQALTLYATQFSSLKLNGCIGDYCSVKSGFAFKSSWWTNSGIRVIKIGSINQDNLNLLECSYVDEDKADKAKDFVVKAGDLLIAMTGATIGKFAMVPYSSEMLLVNQRVGKFFLGNNPIEKLPFIYCTLKQPEVYGEVVNRGQGSAQPNISASDIMSIPCVIPSQDAINDFNNTLQPLFDLIISNQRENHHLSELRNALLPKLMSGELDVSNIEI